jgi:hypothetical protein
VNAAPVQAVPPVLVTVTVYRTVAPGVVVAEPAGTEMASPGTST